MLKRIMKIVRIFILKLKGATLDYSVSLNGSIKYAGNLKNLHIGKNTTINEGVFLNCRDKIIIGNKVRISPYAQLHTGYLDINKKIRFHKKKEITIEDNVWIASGAVISAGVSIGKNSVIGANSVVTKSLKSDTFYAGVPAKKIKEIIYE